MAGHDKAFKALLEEEGVIEALLRERLPARVVRRFAGPMVRLSETFVDEGLKASFADQVVRVQLEGGGEAYVYCIIEHKRRADAYLAVQLLRYMERLYSYLAKRAQGQKLPPVIALVVYNGRRRWAASRRFSGVLDGVDPSLRRMVLDFEFAVLDLGAVADVDLSAHEVLCGGLLALKTATVPEALRLEKASEVIRLLRGQSTLKPFLVYLQWVVGAERMAAVQEAVRKASPEDEESMISIAESLINKGRAEGIDQGLAKGLAKGVAKGVAKGRDAVAALLMQVLLRRFKRVPARHKKLIDVADLDTLVRWHGVAHDAATLDAVFRSH